MYLYGASGHAKVIVEILELLNIPVHGLFDDNPDIKELVGYPVLGPLKDYQVIPDSPFLISIGNNAIRKKVSAQYPLKFTDALVHPRSTISPRASIGNGSVVMGHAIINANTHIGQHAIINTSASIDHDCHIGDIAHISPNATLAGGVTIGEGTHVGSGAIIIPGIKVGRWAIIGAGSVINHDVPDFAVVVGNPGRVIRKNQK